MTKEALDTQEQKRALKAYSKPQLVEYGRVEDITKGSGASVPDFASMQPTK